MGEWWCHFIDSIKVTGLGMSQVGRGLASHAQGSGFNPQHTGKKKKGYRPPALCSEWQYGGDQGDRGSLGCPCLWDGHHGMSSCGKGFSRVPGHGGRQ